MADDVRTTRALRLRLQRERRLDLMASFCRFWNIDPTVYRQLTVEEVEAMTKFANTEIQKQKQAQRKRR